MRRLFRIVYVFRIHRNRSIPGYHRSVTASGLCTEPVQRSLGIYIPLIVVNCIILGRAEAYAAKNGPIESAFDGIGMGLGFTVGLTCIAIVRELIGGGSFFGMEIIPEDFHVTIIGLAPGAFFVLACLTALQNKFKAPSATNGSVPQSTLACGGNCAACSGFCMFL